jgi:formylglycine-generating enzyme required for sulfatase activity
MKKLITIVLICLFSAILLQPETIANVTSYKNLTLTIDRGAMDGVAIGLKGIVKAVYKEPSGEYTINIGIFTVRKVFERTAEVVIEIGKGLNPADARYVVFDPDLVSRESKTEASIQDKAAESAVWHLDQGDRDAEEGKLDSALEHYQKALSLEPKNLVAQEKCNEMKKEIAGTDRKIKFNDYLKKADANYDKNDVKYAFLYVIEALRIYPEGSSEVKGRLVMMAGEYPQEWNALLKEKRVELQDIRPKIDAMLESNSTAIAEPVSAEDRENEYAEDFLQKISGKAEPIRRNEKGFWEAVFAGNITMIYIPGGEFTIGSPNRQGDEDEHPAHKVMVPGFWIGKTEVTFEQYDRFCAESGRKKSEDEGWGRGTRPAIYVSWNDARDYCQWLAKKTGLEFRLPSEAEWEKSARDYYPWGTDSPSASLANFNKDNMQTSPVGSYPKGASANGALDMAGNVWEWVADWYDPAFYRNSPFENPRGPQTGSARVVRGGSWANSSELIRSANRSQEDPASRLNILGFRLALDDH